MATDYQRIKYINQHIQDCVNGFIRESRKELPLNNPYYDIPSLIIYTCILYYHLNEHFTKHGPNVILSKNDSVIMIKKGANIINNVDYDTIYGNIKINLNEPYLCQWTFKVLSLHYVELDDEICFGICRKGDYEDFLLDHGVYYQNGGGMYPWRSGFSEIKYKRFEENDIVKMEFDTVKLSIHFLLNDEKQHIYFIKDGFFKSNEVYMAVSIDGDQPNGVQLLDFKMTKLTPSK